MKFTLTDIWCYIQQKLTAKINGSGSSELFCESSEDEPNRIQFGSLSKNCHYDHFIFNMKTIKNLFPWVLWWNMHSEDHGNQSPDYRELHFVQILLDNINKYKFWLTTWYQNGWFFLLIVLSAVLLSQPVGHGRKVYIVVGSNPVCMKLFSRWF